jgi:hypothetical protein
MLLVAILVFLFLGMFYPKVLGTILILIAIAAIVSLIRD